MVLWVKKQEIKNHFRIKENVAIIMLKLLNWPSTDVDAIFNQQIKCSDDNNNNNTLVFNCTTQVLTFQKYNNLAI